MIRTTTPLGLPPGRRGDFTIVHLLIALAVLAFVLMFLLPNFMQAWAAHNCQYEWRLTHKDFDGDGEDDYPGIPGNDACACDANKNEKIYYAPKSDNCPAFRYRKSGDAFSLSDVDYPNWEHEGQPVPEECKTIDASEIRDPDDPDCWTPSGICKTRISEAIAAACEAKDT